MKKMRVFLALCLTLVFSAIGRGQSVMEYGIPLITDPNQLSSNASDKVEGLHIENLIDGNNDSFWHSDWHGECKDKYHYLQVELEEAFQGDIAIDIVRRNTANDHPTEMLVQGSNDTEKWTDLATVSLPYDGAGTECVSEPFTVNEPYKYLRFNATNCTGSGYAYRTFWHAAEFQIFGLSHEQSLVIKLNNVLLKYDGYLYGTVEFNLGTEYGQFTNSEAASTFMTALKQILAILEGEAEMPSEEEIMNLITTVEENYAAVMASEVVFKATNGYYRIVSALPYYTDNEDGERTIHKKAMFSELEGFASWGEINEKDPRQIWKLTQETGGVRMVNAGTNMQIATMASPVTMSEEANELMEMDYATSEDGKTIIYIRMASSPRDLAGGTSVYLHQWGHSKGAGSGYYLCAWKATAHMGAVYDTDRGTSEWYLEPVSDEEATTLADAYASMRIMGRARIKYLGYLDGTKQLNMGTAMGQYSNTDAYNAFCADLESLRDLSFYDNNGYPTIEEAQAISDRLDQSYQSILDSEVMFELKDGYYRVIANLNYYVDTPTDQVDENGDQIVDRTYRQMAMYSKSEGFGAWGLYDTNDCRQVWKLSREAGGIRMINAATEMQFEKFAAPITMSTEADNLLEFDYVDKENDHDIIYIRMASSERDLTAATSVYLHQWYHGQGSGTGYNLTVWVATYEKTGDKGTSEWYLEPVSDEEANALIEAYQPIKNREYLVNSFTQLRSEANANYVIARDDNRAFSIDTESPMIEETSQFSSLWSDSSEGSLNNLLDNDPNTFWHSNWHAGVQPPHSHSFEVNMLSPIEGTYQARILRRGSSTNDDNITEMSLYGSNDPNALKNKTEEGWTLIEAGIQSPWVRNEIEAWTSMFEINEPYQYLRFYIDDCKGPNTNCRGYAHMGDFQIYPVVREGDAQLDHMGEVADNLSEVLNRVNVLTDEEITYDDYTMLKEAYDAFMQIFVDPTELRELVKKGDKFVSMIAVGDEPGYWKSENDADELGDLLEEITLYDLDAVYTKEQQADYIEKLNTACENFFDKANKISTNKWYRLQFPTLEIMDKYELDKTPASGSTLGAAFGKYVTVGTYQAADEAAGIPVAILETEADSVREGGSFWLVEEPKYKEMTEFRFINIGDSAYVMQNRGSGMFVNCEAANNNNVTLSPIPTTFKLKAVGYGEVVISGMKFDGTSVTNLHLQDWNQRMVTWSHDAAGTNSAWLINTVEDVDANYEPAMKKDIQTGKIYPMCYPESVVAKEGTMYTVAGTYNQNDKKYIALNTITSSKPGVPFIYINGNTNSYIEGDEENPVVTTAIDFALGTEFAAEADSINGLVGLYSGKDVEDGTVIFVGNKAQEAYTDEETTTNHVSHCQAYLNFGTTTVDPNGSYSMVLEIGNVGTSIQDVMANVAKEGNVYNLSGQLLRTKANINTLQSLGRGIYILNGVKIRVQ